MSKTKHERSRGASAVVVAASMIVLLAMAAIAIDLGAGFDERRLDQIAADGSTLAGAVSLIDGQNLSTVIADIKANAQTNLGDPSDWLNCTDPESLGGLTAAEALANGLDPAQPCISFGPNSDGVAFGKVRVRIPDQQTDTGFAQVLGASLLTTNAAAEAELVGSSLYKNFPSMVFSPALPGDEFCIRSTPGPGPAGPEDDCEGSATGNFGIFNPYFYTNDGGFFCSSGNQPRPNAYAIAEGLDHLLAANPGLVNPQVENGSSCPGAGGPLNPNQIRFTSGGDPNITRGLIVGSAGGAPPFPVPFSGRLTKQIWGAYGTASIFGNNIDNRPLWTYIDPAALSTPSTPTSCIDAEAGPADASVEADFIAAEADLLSCLADADVPDDLFLPDVYLSPRLTTVPKLIQGAPCGAASCLYDIDDFVPVFITSIYTDDLGTCSDQIFVDPGGAFCRHDPGRNGTLTDGAPGQRVLRSAKGVVLTCDMLPPPGSGAEKCQNIGSGSGAKTTFVSSRLTR